MSKRNFLAKALLSAILIPSLSFDLPLSGRVLFGQNLDLSKRHPIKMVNDVYRDNILLTLAYLRGEIEKGKNPDWEKIRKPFQYEFRLSPNEGFAFHEGILPELVSKIKKTTKAHFDSNQGFKSDGYLYGDGVCHLASLIFNVAKRAGLEAKAPTNHDFAPIFGIEKEYGVAVFFTGNNPNLSSHQNLYIFNNRGRPVTLKFTYQKDILSLILIEDLQ